MSQRKTSANNPSDWVFFADAELAAIRLLSANETAFFMCRSKCAEVLEKLMKAELIGLGWPLVKTHDLQQLADELKARGSTSLASVQQLAEDLAEYYVVGRYPGFDLEETEDWAELGEQLEKIAQYATVVKGLIAEKAPEKQAAQGAGT